MKELIEIQSELNAPKGQYNTFGKYYYRSCEDILAAVKPILKKNNCTLVLSDEMIAVGNRIYVKATAYLTNGSGEKVTTTAFAREEESKKGMDASQVTGSASSYARKYALNGLFAIDDVKDSDNAQEQAKSQTQDSEELTQEQIFKDYAKPQIDQALTKEDLTRIYNGYPVLHTMSEFMEALTAKRKALGIKNANE